MTDHNTTILRMCEGVLAKHRGWKNPPTINTLLRTLKTVYSDSAAAFYGVDEDHIYKVLSDNGYRFDKLNKGGESKAVSNYNIYDHYIGVDVEKAIRESRNLKRTDRDADCVTYAQLRQAIKALPWVEESIFDAMYRPDIGKRGNPLDKTETKLSNQIKGLGYKVGKLPGTTGHKAIFGLRWTQNSTPLFKQTDKAAAPRPEPAMAVHSKEAAAGADMEALELFMELGKTVGYPKLKQHLESLKGFTE